jgi:hypothetical protein
MGVSEDPYPGHGLLEQALASLPSSTQIIVVLMPPHISLLPHDDDGRASLDQCKRHLAGLVSRNTGFIVDFDIDSPWTRKAENYWDDSHFRMSIAKALMPRVKEAVERRRDAEDGVYRTQTGSGSWAGR